jgi:hypothetical protein
MAGWNGTDEFDGAGHHGDSIAVRRFPAFELPDFCFRVEMRSDCANNFDGADAVSDGHHFLFINSSLAGPDAPLTVDGAGGIDEHSVEVE